MLHFFLVAAFSFLAISAKSELVISDASIGANPFQYSGFGAGKITLNPDGTQSVYEPPNSVVGFYVQFPSRLDLTGNNEYNAIALRAKLEPDHARSGELFLDFAANFRVRQIYRLSFDDFNHDGFSTLVIPFDSFQAGTVGIDLSPGIIDFSRVEIMRFSSGPPAPSAVHFTIDRVSAITIPEPSTYALIMLGVAAILFGRKMKQLSPTPTAN